jgi:hypothetical protein
MANRFECDRCRLVQATGESAAISIDVSSYTFNDNRSRGHELKSGTSELCKECAEQFFRYMQLAKPVL